MTQQRFLEALDQGGECIGFTVPPALQERCGGNCLHGLYSMKRRGPRNLGENL